MRRERTLIIAEIALTVALAAVLNTYLKIRLPWNIAGGEVSLAMLPILVLSLRRGVVPGVIAGALFGFVDMLIDPYFVHPLQVALDYPIAWGALGIAGLGSAAYYRALDTGAEAKAALVAIPWMVLGVAGRFTASFVSGVVFFAANAPKGQPVVLYSALYNLSYLAPSLILCIIAAAALLPVLQRAVPARTGSVAS